MPYASRYKRKTLTSNNNYELTAKKSKYAKTKSISLSTNSNTVQYARSLVNPFSELTPKVPDLSCQPTHSFKTELDFNWDPNDAGLDRILVLGFSTTDRDSVYLPFLKTSSTVAPLGGIRMTASSTDITLPFITNITNNYSTVRPVSVGLYCEYVGPDTNNSGIIRCCQVNSAELAFGNNVAVGTVNTSNLWDWGKIGGAAATAYNYGISTEMIDNARISYTGPAKFGAYQTWRPLQSEYKFYEGRAFTNAANLRHDTYFVFRASTENAATVSYQCKLVINWEGTVIDTTYPMPDVKNSPMDVYGFQAAVEAALATSCTESLSEGIKPTFNALEKTAVNKFAQVVALSAGR